jgi:Na+/proline symporter
MGWVTRGMIKVLEVTTGIDPLWGALVLFGMTALYSMVAGLWGVVLTDVFQFLLAMAGSILLAVLAVNAIGGLDALTAAASQHFGSRQAAVGVLPPLDGAWLPISSLVIFLAVQWWASWYPGAEPGGGGYVAQRILSTKNERHGLLATLWFNIAHYALRPWPWILVGLFAVVQYPGLADPEKGYVQAMRDLLPSPLKGLMLAAFAAAYMSTIATHLNWGASYLVNDVWLRFVRKDASPREQVWISRVTTALLMGLTIPVMLTLTSVEQGWRILFALGAGTGAVFILRWYWWRVSAWSEIIAMGASLITSVVIWNLDLAGGDPTGRDYAVTMMITVGVTTVAWVVGTLLTPAESDAVLERFYRRVRPGGPGWRRVATRLGFAGDTIPGGALSWVNWVAGWLAIYAALFGVGQLLVGTLTAGVGLLAAAAVLFAVIARNLRQDPSFQDGAVDSPGPTV